MTDALLQQILGFILASAVGVAAVAWLRLPSALGYLAAGLTIGPHGLGLLAASAETRLLAELGVVFLMFMVGLEFSLPRLLRARRDVLGGGGAQVGLTASLVAAGARLAGAEWATAVILGGAIAMSSTAVSLKQLTDQGETGSEHGRRAVGILLFQDLATLPFLLLVGAWAADADASDRGAARQLAIAALALGAAATISRPVLRRLLAWVARARSSDLLLLVALLLALGTAAAAHAVGISAPIGAFLAGMVVGESDFRHQVEDDVRPFRDVLLGLFFVTVGMQVDLSILAAAPGAALVWTLAYGPGKALVCAIVGRGLGWPPAVALRVAAILAHGGEFGMLLLTQAMAAGLVAREIGQPVLVALVATMAIAPLAIQRNAAIARRLGGVLRLDRTDRPADELAPVLVSDHVVLCGYGRMGSLVALALQAAKLPCITIESDLGRLRDARRRGHSVVFGDASRVRVLEAAGIARARLLVVTFHHQRVVERLLHHVRGRRPDLASLVSATDEREAMALAGLAGVVLPENLAAGLALADQALLLCGLGQDDAARAVAAVRAELDPELEERRGV